MSVFFLMNFVFLDDWEVTIVANNRTYLFQPRLQFGHLVGKV